MIMLAEVTGAIVIVSLIYFGIRHLVMSTKTTKNF